ncbi:bacterial alpha-L-rhamnosidase-domain-containing protein [Aspergillus avenaceus]|uniref:alpha-L-rhamnosidase n=1 Tax=Aspergillus avenaceus TaxID=36643 RepID=A0A5N6TZM8_ASPAV|nr:bacterial alpha-L-rhamnosidase-domain-containing protein [Aspergillus avenaceus]
MTYKPVLAPPSAEQHATGFGVNIATPRLSWRFLNTSKDCPLGWEQTAYEIQILRSSNAPVEAFKETSNVSVLVPWPSTPLQSREKVQVRVRVYGACNEGAQSEPTDWSPWSTIECALLHRHDWKALPIASTEDPPDDIPLRPVRFRKFFHLQGPSAIKQARLYITSFGVYRAFINGQAVGDQCMAPGWTSYHHRLNYQVFDVATLLNPNGPNVIAVEVGEGWYSTRLGFRGGRRNLYGKQLAVLAQLETQSDQGDAFSLVTDSTWACHPSAILQSEIYDGETYDAREEDSNWKADVEGTSSSSWSHVQELSFPSATLVSPNAPPVRITEEVKAVEVIQTPSGKTVVDFGQNLVGRLYIRSIKKPEGARITFTHAEVLEHGELGTRPLRHAKCTDEFISAGTEFRDWSPQYTFHGFRYVQVDGWTGEDPHLITTLTALVMHTDMTRTGWFSCSHPMVNQLHKNAWWSMRGNFLSIPTDCPQRDERLGWTGDIQIFCPSASFLYNTAGMLGNWLDDVAAEQLKERDGCVPPFVVPNVISEELWPHVPQAIWDDVVVLTPWDLYQSYGDTDILCRQYTSMIAWVDRGIRRGPDGLWDPQLWQLGDWLDPTAPPVEPGDARTNGTLVADAYLVHVTSIMAQISETIGETENAARFHADSHRLKATFQAKYIAPSGLLVGDTQTALSLALMYDLHSTAEQATAAADRLVHLVRQAKFRVATGFAGTPIIAHALTKAGHHQVAYRMLLEKSRPSWMYPITMGATTVWERWDSMLPDGSINPGEMTSFNHYALGSIINWLHSSVAGVRPIAPGWKQFRVEPVPGGTITSAEVAYETPYGRVECRWSFDAADDRFNLDLLVPPNSRALVILPSEERWKDRGLQSGDEGTWVGSGYHRYSYRWSGESYRSGWPPKPIIPIMRKPEPETIA